MKVWEHGECKYRRMGMGLRYLSYVGVCPSLNEIFDNGRGARLGSVHERRPAITVLDIDIRTELHQIEQSLKEEGSDQSMDGTVITYLNVLV